MPQAKNFLTYIVYADDTTISIRSNNLCDFELQKSEIESEAEQWFTSNNLICNKTKSQGMMFTLRNYETSTDAISTVKFLGVYLDPHLRWNIHIDNICRKLSSRTFVIRNLSGTVSTSTLRSAYFALCHSIMSYAVIVWGDAADFDRVFSIQRRIIRIIACLGYTDDCKNAFIEFGILTLPSLYILECLTYIKTNLSNYPTYFNQHDHNTRTKHNIITPYYRLSKSQNGPNYLAIQMFNKLPSNIKNIENLNIFRNIIKSFLIGKAFYHYKEFLECDIPPLNIPSVCTNL